MLQKSSRYIQFLLLSVSFVAALLAIQLLKAPLVLAISNFAVNTTMDSHDAAPGDSLCADSNGFCSLRAALEETNTLPGANEVTLPAGTYVLTYGELMITDDLTLTGVDTTTTIVDGQNISRIFRADNPNGIVQIQISLENMTITNGNAPSGGGIWNDENLSLINVVLTQHVATDLYGGAIYNDQGTLIVASCTMMNNTAETGGGGIYSTGDSSALHNRVFVDHSTFSNNTSVVSGGGAIYLYNSDLSMAFGYVADNLAWGSGGGIYANSSDLTISDSSFTNNQATDGGGIYEIGGDVALARMLFEENIVTQKGGGLYLDVRDGTLLDLTVRNNTAGTWGGGIYFASPFNSLYMLRSKITGNIATYAGGGFYADLRTDTLFETIEISENTATYGGGVYLTGFYSIPAFLNTTVSGNHAYIDGGGIYYAAGSLTSLVNTTIASNIADSDNNGTGNGGGIYLAFGNLHLRNSLLGDNVDQSGEASDCSGPGLLSQGYNLVENPSGCNFQPIPGDITEQDAQLGPLADNGGNTRTHSLGMASPALNTGSCTEMDGTPVLEDQRSLSRPQGPGCEMGAYEFAPFFIHKYTDTPSPLVGQRITYTINVINTTGSLVTGAIVSDTLPLGLILADPISLNPPDAGVPGTGTPIVAEEIILDPGAQLTITLPVTITSGIIPGYITNTVTITSTTIPTPTLSSHEIFVCGDTIAVTSTADQGIGTLRDALWKTCPEGTITFDLTFPATITLSSGELTIDKSLKILGPGAENLTVDGNHAHRVFYVGFGVERVTLSGLTIQNGEADGYGGGILSNSEMLTVTQSIIQNNVAGGGYVATNGGGIAHFNVLTLVDSSIHGNSARKDGGGIYCNNAKIIQSLIWDNQAVGTTFPPQATGGGIACYGAVTILNSTVSANEASSAGGGIAQTGTMTVSHSTLTNNTAGYGAGGLSASETIGSVVLANTIISGNYDGYGAPADCSGTLISAGHNLFGTLSNCPVELLPTDLSGVNPLFSPLADFGGPTWLHALLPGSPAIEAGDCLDPTGALVTIDQRGGTRPQGLSCDMGAFEFSNDLAVSQSASSSEGFTATPLTYTLSVSNLGPFTATQVVLTDTLPIGGMVTYIEPPASATCLQKSVHITCQMGSLAPGEVLVLTFSLLTPPIPGMITNEVAVHAQEPDHASANNLSTIQVMIYSPFFYLPLVLR